MFMIMGNTAVLPLVKKYVYFLVGCEKDFSALKHFWSIFVI